MKTILLLIMSAFTASAATLYPVMSDNTNRTITGGTTNLALLNTSQTFTGNNVFSSTGTKITAGGASAASYEARTQLFGFFRGDVPTTFGHRIQGSFSASGADSTLSFDASSGSSTWVTPLVINGSGTVFLGGTNAGVNPSLTIGTSGTMGITGNFGAGDTSPAERLVVSGGRAKILSGVVADGSTWENRATALSFYRTNVTATYENKISFSANGSAADSTMSLEVASGASTTTNAITANGLGNVAVGSGAPVARLTVVGGPVALTAISAPSPISGNALIYSKTSGTTEMWVMDSGGTETQISPHSANAPRWFYDREPGLEHVVESKQNFLGVVTFINVERAAVLSAMTDAEKLTLAPKSRKTRHIETFAEYNARLGKTGGNALVKLDWEERRASELGRALARWQANTNASKGPAPTVSEEPKPTFIP